MLSDDMIENENESLRERVADLEKKVHDQTDEIVCLRSTLADVLRRLNQLENFRGSNQALNHISSSKEGHGRLRKQPSSESRDPHRRSSSYTHGSHGHSYGPASQGPAFAREATLAHRRSTHYQSTGSLHSDSTSNSASPAPSPSPTHTTHISRSSPSTLLTSPQYSNSNLHFAKRWSSTSDFRSVHSAAGGLGSKTKDAIYNPDEGYVKMYIRGRPTSLYVPSSVIETYSISKVSPAPLAKLKLEWVYGYRGKDCRSNLYLLPTGEVVYFVAAVVILYNVEEQMQRHYLGHTDDVKCIAVHPNKLLIASGQTAGHDRREGRPHIRIWNSVSLHTLHVIGIGELERSVCCLSFSKADGGSLLCAVDEASDHNISVWEWQKGERGNKITETKCSSDTVVAADFHPVDKNVIVTCGKGHVSFWSLDGGTLTKKLGLFENRDKPKYVTCIAFSQTGDVLTGDSNGSISVWGRGTNTISKYLRNAHEGPVFSICVLKDGNFISGGGKDGRLVLWDSNCTRMGIEIEIPEHFGSVRVISEGKGSQILVGTTRNCILQGNFELPFQLVVMGHTEELWGLATHPTQHQFLTAGYDRMVHLWDTLAHSVVWSKDIGEQAQSACISPDGNIIIIGTISGRWLVMDSETRELYSIHTDGTEAIQVVRFSPDKKFLALGSRDNMIYIYQVSEDCRKYNRIGRCTGHSSFLTHIDWSADSTYFQSNSGDYEVLYWNAATCRQITQTSQLRDVKWSTQTCTLNFNTVGIWPEGADGTDVNGCDRSHDGKLLVTGDDFGKVKLYTNPATQPKSLCHIYGGHSSHVTRIMFLHDDTRVISTGGRDTCIMQWAVC